MLKKIIKNLVLWRLAIIVVSVVAVFALPVKDCCHQFGSQPDFTYLTNIWANFAGSDFLDLAKFGYGYPLKLGTYVFFPLFPKIIRLFTAVIPNYLASGLLVSHLSLVLAFYYLYRLVLLDFKKEVAWLTLGLLLIFPTSFFFGAVYTESFFLLLVVLSFYLVRRQKYFPACFLALLAASTRLAGIFLWPALIWEMWQTHSKRTKKEGFDPALVWLLLPPLGLFAYMKLLLVKTGDALFFLKISPDFGPNLVVSKLILLHQVFFRYAKMLLFTRPNDLLYVVVLLEFIVGLLFLVLTILAFRKMRLSYAIYMLLSCLIPTFTGTFVSLPRYVLTVFPGFILLAIWFSHQSSLMKRFYIAVNIALAIVATALFTRGYFVG